MNIDITNRVLAVDGDTIAYRTAAVCEDHFEGACEAIIDNTLRDIATDTGIEQFRIYISGENNFRKAISKTKPYKGNRATMVHPKYLDHCKNYLRDKYYAIKCHGFEADDGIASDMAQNNAIHCGQDKDILQVPGDHYNYIKKEWITVTPEEAEIILYRQVLMGDTSDNIPGLPRVGAKTAESLIFDHKTAREDALSVYREVCEEKLPDVDYEEYFEEQYNLIKMVTNLNPLSFITKVVEVDTQGFETQDGEDLDTEATFEKKEVRL